MAITELSIVDQISVEARGFVSVRRADKVIRDGVEIASTYHRHVLSPGDDLSNEDQRVVAIATAVWTPDIVAAYKAMRAAELERIAAQQQV